MIKYLVVIIIAALIIIFAPFASIWSLNTLFALGIEYTIETWGAALILGSVVGGGYFRKS
jgi:hypothetical protein